jgi:hypothetical protein
LAVKAHGLQLSYACVIAVVLEQATASWNNSLLGVLLPVIDGTGMSAV